MSVRLALVMLLAALLLAACDGGGSERRTGIDVVDTVIEAIETGDIETIVSMMEFSEAPCYEIPRPEGELPLPENSFIECEAGETDRELVAAFLHQQCSGGHMLRPDRGTDDLRSILAATGATIYAVYTRETTPDVRYTVMLTSDYEGRGMGAALLLDEAGVVGIDTCVLEQSFGEAILPPVPTPATSD